MYCSFKKLNGYIFKSHLKITIIAQTIVVLNNIYIYLYSNNNNNLHPKIYNFKKKVWLTGLVWFKRLVQNVLKIMKGGYRTYVVITPRERFFVMSWTRVDCKFVKAQSGSTSCRRAL